jgi:hypothetical protein
VTGMWLQEPCILHDTAECTRCMCPGDLLRWRVRNDPALSIGWGRFYDEESDDPAHRGSAAGLG